MEKYFYKVNRKLPNELFGEGENVYEVALQFLVKELKLRLKSIKSNTLEGSQKSSVHGMKMCYSLQFICLVSRLFIKVFCDV